VNESGVGGQVGIAKIAFFWAEEESLVSRAEIATREPRLE